VRKSERTGRATACLHGRRGVERRRRTAAVREPILSVLAPAVLIMVLFACRCSPRTSEPENAVLFQDVAAASGLQFEHFAGATGHFYMPEIMGPGAALFDYDGDGDLDVYLLQGTMLEPGKRPEESQFPPAAGWKPGNRLFRNELIPTGKLQFTDVTAQAGVGHAGYGMGAAVGDYNGDGHPDLYITNYGPNVLYRNNGDGTFTDVTREAGVNDPRWSASATFFDYDGDGDLDLYVASYLDFTLRGNQECFDAVGQRNFCAPSAYRGTPDKLFRNDGNGRFTDVSVASGIALVSGPSLGVAARDFNGDGWPDLYVANDGAANWLWLNQRDGTFQESALLLGAAYSADGMPRAGMGIAAEDFDGDGDVDVLVTNLSREGSTLYRNNGRGEFQDASMELQIHHASLPYTGFGVGWFDYDNDGRLDLLAVNGAVTVIEALRGEPYPFHQKNQLLQAQADGKFRDVTALAGPAMQLSEVSRGAAFGDIDNDGKVDVLITNNNGPVRLLRNETGSRRHWLQVRLRAPAPNPAGLGSRVGLLREGASPVWRYVQTDGSYLVAGDVRVHFGLGDDRAIQAVLVQWPDGSRERWDKPAADTVITLEKGTGLGVSSAGRRAGAPNVY
jgi:hypothetical protein